MVPDYGGHVEVSSQNEKQASGRRRAPIVTFTAKLSSRLGHFFS